MTDTLFIQLPTAQQNNDSATIQWALYDAEQKVTSGNSTLADAISKTADIANKQIVALAPSTDILQTLITVPPGQKRHLQRTLPFLVEEEIATPIEEMHLCASPVQRDQTTVLIVANSAMQQWLQQLKEHQLEADWLLPESAALGTENGLEILMDSQGVHFYCPQQPVINTEFDNLTFVADSLIEQFTEGNAPTTGVLLLSKQLSEAEQSAAAALAAQFEVAGISLKQQEIHSSFDYRCAQLQSKLTQGKNNYLINLLNGAYRNTSKRQSNSSPRWGLLAMTVAICIVLKLLLDLGSGLYLQQQSKQLDENITSLYRDLFPQDKRIVNAKVQMQNHLKGVGSAGAGSGFMPLITHIAEALDNLGASQATELQQLRYSDNNQTLMVDLKVKEVQQLEEIKQMIETRNVKVSILSANEDRQWINGRLRLAL